MRTSDSLNERCAKSPREANPPGLLNAAALLCNGVGLLLTVLVYQKPDSRTIMYNKSELPAIRQRDRSRHRLALAGFIVLGLAFCFQPAAELSR
ncbi:MAG: hypothetical protein IPJ76_06330 [Flavobacteriales bacterium]|nr:MAG: hypothetical protein IPJ76_06330 [Flavobacteriales bacterium]